MSEASTRYTLVLDDMAAEHVERLQAAFRFGTKAEVYELGVRMLTWVTEQQASGLEVGRFDAQRAEFQPLLLPVKLGPDLRVDESTDSSKSRER